ncbi:helix-turn-helix domain-containing protein [Ensifer adhaerens]
MLDLDVIDAPAAAALALEPIKARLLAELAAPASAAALAVRVGLTRQKVNYHLRALEEHKLIEPAEQRRWGGLTERLMVATATSYVVSPAALGPIAADPGRSSDRLSASYLVALAARMVREVGGSAAQRPHAGQAPGDAVDRHRDQLSFACGARRLYRRSRPGGERARRALPR